MGRVETIRIGGESIVLGLRETVGPPTPYSLLLAESLPDLKGLDVVDIGTGSGVLAIAAALRGADRVRIVDTNPAAVACALENAVRNGVGDRLQHLPVGRSIIPLPEGETVDAVISNPAQLPLPEAAEATNPYYAGPDGRRTIEEVITAAPARLSAAGRLFMVLNSVTDFPKSLALMESVGLRPRILAERSLELRPLFDREWLDKLGGVARGLYSLDGGRAFETFHAVEARRA